MPSPASKTLQAAKVVIPFSVLIVVIAFSVNFLQPPMASKLRSVDFEVFGLVQGVFFRKFTHDEAKKHDLFGWVKNTKEGTVVGVVQGPESKLDIMKNWLKSVGSPQSRIDRCEFKNEREIETSEFSSFSVIRDPGED